VRIAVLLLTAKLNCASGCYNNVPQPLLMPRMALTILLRRAKALGSFTGPSKLKLAGRLAISPCGRTWQTNDVTCVEIRAVSDRCATGLKHHVWVHSVCTPHNHLSPCIESCASHDEGCIAPCVTLCTQLAHSVGYLIMILTLLCALSAFRVLL
jgi:hypothetical protein